MHDAPKHVLRQVLRERGYDVVALVRPSSASSPAVEGLRGHGVRIVLCDVCRADTLEGAVPAHALAVVACLGSRKPSQGDVYAVDKQVAGGGRGCGHVCNTRRLVVVVHGSTACKGA